MMIPSDLLFDTILGTTTRTASTDTIRLSRILLSAARPRILLLPAIMAVKNPLCKDDDTEKPAAVYAHAANHATPAVADTQMQRIFTWYMVKLIVLLFS